MNKVLLFVAFVALSACVLADEEPQHTYLPPTYPCVWTIDADVSTLLTHNKYKLYVNSNYFRTTHYSHSNVLMEDTVFRPDVKFFDNSTNKTYFSVFSYSSGGCSNHSKDQGYDLEAFEKKPLEYLLGTLSSPVFDLFLHNHTFFNKTAVNWEGQECTVYFDLDMDTLAYYVNKDNLIVGIVAKRDIPDQRTTYKFKWGYKSPYQDYTFDKNFVYNCTDPSIFEAPTRENAKCGASSLQVVAAVILVSLVSSLIALF